MLCKSAFGARNGASPVVLGAAKVTLGLLFGSSLLQLMQALPGSILGAMLVVAGVELAACSRAHVEASEGGGPGDERAVASAGAWDGDARADMLLVLITAAVSGVTRNVAVGAAGGVLCSVVIRLPGWVLTLERERPLASGSCGGGGGGPAAEAEQQPELRQLLLPA